MEDKSLPATKEQNHKQPTAPEVIANMPRRDTYSSEHGSGNPHLQPGELQKVWHPDKQEKPKK
jgi:hypothetical protein